MGPEGGMTGISFIFHVFLLVLMVHECCERVLPSCCGGDGYHALANVDQDKLSALLAEVCLEVAPFHACGRPEGPAVVCGSGLSLHRI
jgi:hypothetical protein